MHSTPHMVLDLSALASSLVTKNSTQPLFLCTILETSGMSCISIRHYTQSHELPNYILESEMVLLAAIHFDTLQDAIMLCGYDVCEQL